MAAIRILALSLLAGQALAQTSVSDSRTTETATSITTSENATPTGPYQSYSSQVSQGSSMGSIPVLSSTIMSDNTTATTTNRTTQSTSTTITFLTGTKTEATSTMSGNSTASSTSSSMPSQTNTTPCNNYPEFCARKYSNITEVACHNSPFITPNNLAANQEFDVTTQLDDGVRFLQAQIQWPTNGNEPHFCHTSCDILDAGVITDWLTQVTTWVAKHPYDVVTILLGNGNFSAPAKYVPYIEESGILPFVYTPPVRPMRLNDWPTLEDMILKGQRVVMFLDYMANQTAYPWLLDEFSQMWESPFDPTNQSFPCTVERPPDLPKKDAQDRLFLINHNFNLDINLLGAEMLVPAREELNVTNNVTGYGSLGVGADLCVSDWNRPPKFLNVDYYNYGGFPGSVFEVQAQMNNVTYNRPCCGIPTSGASGLTYMSELVYSVLFATALWVFI